MLATCKLTLIEQKTADLVAMQQLLGGLVRQCDAGDDGAICPIIETLNKD
jgi:MerR family mercuric resistance operon transcriptional regulator